MKFRLKEGQGQAFYFIGYDDDGKNTGIAEEEFLTTIFILDYMSKQLDFNLVVKSIQKGLQGFVAKISI